MPELVWIHDDPGLPRGQAADPFAGLPADAARALREHLQRPFGIPVPKIEQVASYSCGAAALLACLRYWRAWDAPEAALWAQLGTTKKNGTGPDEIAAVAIDLGLDAEVRTGMSLGDLMNEFAEGATIMVAIQAWPASTITPADCSNGHYVVLVGFDEGAQLALFMDPRLGDYAYLPYAEFEAAWRDRYKGQCLRGIGIVIVGESPLPGPFEPGDPQLIDTGRGRVEEGKAIGSADMGGGDVRQRDARLRLHWPSTAKFHIRAASTNVTKKLEAIAEDAILEVGTAINAWLAGEVTYNDAAEESTHAWRKAYERVREVGRAASGLSRMHPDPKVLAEEERWFRSAVREELRFWHLFMEEVRSGALTEGRIRQRFYAYVDALRFMYEASRVYALPDNVLLYWMGPKPVAQDPSQAGRICGGCTYMMERSPFPKAKLPAVPRDGCLSGPDVLVSTRRGLVSVADVEVGDEVRTHRGRWRPVTATFVHRARDDHRYAAIVTQDGLVGVTDDHNVWTAKGWVSGREAAERNLRVLQETDEGAKQDGSMPSVWVGSLGVGAAPSLGGSHACFVRHGEEGRTALRPPLGRRGREVALCLSESMGVGAGEGFDSGRDGSASQEHRSHGRPYRQLRVAAEGTASADTRRDAESPAPRTRVREMRPEVQADSSCGSSRGVLLSSLLRRARGCDSDPIVRLLWKELRAKERRDARVEVGQVILLSRVLPGGSALYDLEVADDASFIADGMIVHNSTACLANCRHKIVVRVGTPQDVRARFEALPSRATMMLALKRIKDADHGTHRQTRARAHARRTAARGRPHVHNPFHREPIAETFDDEEDEAAATSHDTTVRGKPALIGPADFFRHEPHAPDSRSVAKTDPTGYHGQHDPPGSSLKLGEKG